MKNNSVKKNFLIIDLVKNLKRNKIKMPCYPFERITRHLVYTSSEENQMVTL